MNMVEENLFNENCSSSGMGTSNVRLLLFFLFTIFKIIQLVVFTGVFSISIGVSLFDTRMKAIIQIANKKKEKHLSEFYQKRILHTFTTVVQVRIMQINGMIRWNSIFCSITLFTNELSARQNKNNALTGVT